MAWLIVAAIGSAIVALCRLVDRLKRSSDITKVMQQALANCPAKDRAGVLRAGARFAASVGDEVSPHRWRRSLVISRSRDDTDGAPGLD
jgi:hypothetical protein